MKRHYTPLLIADFRRTSTNEILGEIVVNREFDVEGREAVPGKKKLRILKKSIGK